MRNRDHMVSLLEACIELELGVAALYRCFSELFPEDRPFWSQLQLEEKHHAGLLRAALDSYSKRGLLPRGMVPASLQELVDSNIRIANLLNQCESVAPSRAGAFELAIALEQESGEHHYNTFMEQESESTIEHVFQQLNRDDKDHEERIRSYHERLLQAED